MRKLMNSYSFLVVDDDAQVRAIVVEFLQSFGFINVVEAKDGVSAIKILQERSQKFDVIISDWEMPGADGLTLLKAVRKNPVRRGTRFIMLTSQRSMERYKVTQAARWKADAYILKPFRGEILREKIFQVLGISHLLADMTGKKAG
jgi:two-component system, chemotaxis family, chemotaxis protein CheY